MLYNFNIFKNNNFTFLVIAAFFFKNIFSFEIMGQLHEHQNAHFLPRKDKKNYLRNLSDDLQVRLTGRLSYLLTLFSIHRQIEINPDDMIDHFKRNSINKVVCETDICKTGKNVSLAIEK